MRDMNSIIVGSICGLVALLLVLIGAWCSCRKTRDGTPVHVKMADVDHVNRPSQGSAGNSSDVGREQLKKQLTTKL